MQSFKVKIRHSKVFIISLTFSPCKVYELIDNSSEKQSQNKINKSSNIRIAILELTRFQDCGLRKFLYKRSLLLICDWIYKYFDAIELNIVCKFALC